VSFPRYEKYKDSGVEWLGEVPEHWRLQPLWTHFRRIKRAGFAEEELLSVYRDYGVIPKSSRDDNFNNPSDDLGTYQLVEPGDLVLNKMKAWQGSVAISEHRGIVSPAYFVYAATHTANGRFLHYLMRSLRYISGYLSLSKGIRVNQWDIDPQYHSRMPIVLPSLSEQQTIATFLDRETAKIDALVAEQERLIALLAEKRQAVISHAVTKGLNPDATMKDSGIEWLGEVPEHWERVQLGCLCRQVSDGPHFSPSYVDEGVMFISARNIRIDGWSLEDAKYVSEDDYREFCKRVVPEVGDVLYTKGGTTGIARVVDFEERFQVWVHVAVLKLRKAIALPPFVAHSLNSIGCYEQSQLYTRGATNQDLGLTRMVKIFLALPPIKEQAAIVSHLDAETSRLDGLKVEVEQSITLLKERRAALISAAVTGKIDVRGYAEKEAA